MVTVLQQIPIERLLLLVFLAGSIWQKFLRTAESLKHQGIRMGEVEKKVAAIESELRARGRIP